MALQCGLTVHLVQQVGSLKVSHADGKLETHPLYTGMHSELHYAPSVIVYRICRRVPFWRE